MEEKQTIIFELENLKAMPSVVSVNHLPKVETTKSCKFIKRLSTLIKVQFMIKKLGEF